MGWVFTPPLIKEEVKNEMTCGCSYSARSYKVYKVISSSPMPSLLLFLPCRYLMVWWDRSRWGMHLNWHGQKGPPFFPLFSNKRTKKKNICSILGRSCVSVNHRDSQLKSKLLIVKCFFNYYYFGLTIPVSTSHRRQSQSSSPFFGH